MAVSLSLAFFRLFFSLLLSKFCDTCQDQLISPFLFPSIYTYLYLCISSSLPLSISIYLSICHLYPSLSLWIHFARPLRSLLLGNKCWCRRCMSVIHRALPGTKRLPSPSATSWLSDWNWRQSGNQSPRKKTAITTNKYKQTGQR